MKQLASKPIFLSLVLLLPLWIVLGNFIVAAIGALLLAFLVTMCRSLYILKRQGQHSQPPASEAPDSD